MKKILIGAFVLIATMNFGCGERTFNFTTAINQSGIYTVNDVGTFSKSAFIGRENVARAFSLPEGAKVTELKIESLSLKVTLGTGNTAQNMTVSGEEFTPLGGSLFMFQNHLVPLGSANPNTPIGLNNLIPIGIEKLKTELENYVRGAGTSDGVTLVLSGTASPANSRMMFTISLDIKASVKYKLCELALPGTGGDNCDSSNPNSF